jgi:hypothetical protein
MIAEQPKSPHGLPLPINFKIPAYWTPEQALAVFELLDDLRDQIGAHYSVQLFELSREQHLRARTDQDDRKVDDQSFRTPQSEGPQTGPFRISTTRRRIMYGSSPPATTK